MDVCRLFELVQTEMKRLLRGSYLDLNNRYISKDCDIAAIIVCKLLHNPIDEYVVAFASCIFVQIMHESNQNITCKLF